MKAHIGWVFQWWRLMAVPCRLPFSKGLPFSWADCEYHLSSKEQAMPPKLPALPVTTTAHQKLPILAQYRAVVTHLADVDLLCRVTSFFAQTFIPRALSVHNIPFQSPLPKEPNPETHLVAGWIQWGIGNMPPFERWRRHRFRTSGYRPYASSVVSNLAFEISCFRGVAW